MGEFTFAGEHSSAYHVRLLKSPISMLPGTRDKAITLPGRHGVLRMLPDFQERTLKLECWLAAANMAEMHERLQRVRAWLNPLRGQQRLILGSTPDKYYSACLAGSSLDAEITARQARFTASFVCPDPFAYAVLPDVVTLLASPHIHRQRGTAPADPLLRLQGTSLGSWQTLSVQIGGHAVTYTGALATEDWLEVDCASKTASRVMAQSRVSVMHLLARPTFPQLSPDANVITVSATGGAAWSRLEIRCRNRWL